MRRKLIAGNWKMNAPPAAREMIETVAEATIKREDIGIVICAPATMIAPLHGHGVRIGGQDCHAEASGAHTGDLSAEMLAAVGASHVIVGHSERRSAYGESDAVVRAKAKAAHRADLTAIICVGESASERAGGDAIGIVCEQVRIALPPGATTVNTVIAYEPVWAIGTGAAASPEDIEEMHSAIREQVAKSLGDAVASNMRILYGGSMNAENASSILALEDVDGGLIGGASLRSDSFLAIIDAA